jgi:hypothetical protein
VTTAPAAVLDAMTAAILAGTLDRVGEVDEVIRRHLERIAHLDAQAAWDALVGVSEVRDILSLHAPGDGYALRGRWLATCEAWNHAEFRSLYPDAVTWRRLIITTRPEEAGRG